VAQRGGRGIALLFQDLGARWSEGSAARPGRTLPLGKTRYPLYRRLGGHQGRSGRAENLTPTGIRSPDRPARSQSLYRLSYPAHFTYAYTMLYSIYYRVCSTNKLLRRMMSVYQHNNQQVTYFRYIAYKPCQTFCTVRIINFWIYVWPKFAETTAKCYRN